MVNQNPEFVKELLLNQIDAVQTDILAAFQTNRLQASFQNHLQTGTRYNGNGKVEAYLAFSPDDLLGSNSLDLTLRLDCTPRGAMLTTEIAWSDGRVIDGVFVCNFCPDCLEHLSEQVDQVLDEKRGQMVGRMVDILGNFQPA